ncbi:hypothetical protein NECAME_14754 [Necator americanus]|uniref:Uncharacterized protein n=1 Tax=Necator americanus TaxID=51031 RepID=W2SLF8_NECAM|nr:hypothetical protein NECAME_14754 [Necator americanus]ETN70445.1 hypothetical protein NECAME_14754 [Necator americanus]
MEKFKAKQDTRSIKTTSFFAEDIVMNMSHKITTHAGKVELCDHAEKQCHSYNPNYNNLYSITKNTCSADWKHPKELTRKG